MDLKAEEERDAGRGRWQRQSRRDGDPDLAIASATFKRVANAIARPVTDAIEQERLEELHLSGRFLP